MDGMMAMGTPWLDKPVTLHAYREFECQFNDTQLCEYEQGYWRFWYEADHRYAVPTTVLFTAVIVVFAIAHLFNQFIPNSIQRMGPVRRITAAGRFLSYRAFRVPALDWNSAPVGVLALGVVGAIFFFCMTLVPKPYYWPNTDTINFGSSPPIATRSGWLSLGCMPFVFLTAGKSNFITAVTGISHEKLQVLHRWISYAFFVTALIHTFPFIVYNIQTGTMVESWNSMVYYWTGVIALIAQAWLTFASFSPLRSLSYEWFKFSHFVAALVFVLFLFFHCDHTLSAWDYFIATGVLFSLSWLHRQIRVYFEHGVGHRATASLAPNGFVCVRVPTTSTWGVGQHFFVRFLSFGLHAWSIHPFTACSLPEVGSSFDRITSELVFYIRPRGGFTSRLARHAATHPNSPIRILLDGPYGGIDMQKLLSNQRQLIIAGGAGAGWLLPVISAFLRRQEYESENQSLLDESLSARVVFATRDVTTRRWFEDAVSELLESSTDGKAPKGLSIEVHYTGPSGSSEEILIPGASLQDASEAEKAISTEQTLVRNTSDSDTSSDMIKPPSVRHSSSRPDLPAIIHSEAASLSQNGELGVFVCGPLSMQSDVSNTVAAQQLRILKDGSKSIYLHMEHFSWA